MSREARRLLAQVRSVSAPTAADRAAVRRSLAAKLAAGAVTTTLAHPAVAGSFGLAKLSLAAQFTLALVGGATFGGVAMVTSHQLASSHSPQLSLHPSPSNRIAAASQPLPVVAIPNATGAPAAVFAIPMATGAPAAVFADPEGEVTIPSVTEQAREAQPSAKSVAVSKPGSVAPARPSLVTVSRGLPEAVISDGPPSLAAEGRALARVQQCLKTRDGNLALQLLAEQDRDYAQGALAEERAAARVYALCDIGRREAARAGAAEFVSRWPRSPLAARVLATCNEPSTSHSVKGSAPPGHSSDGSSRFHE